MVRIKNRYLLVNILYPGKDSRQPETAPLPDIMLFNQPTTKTLTTSLLTKSLRTEVSKLFGDYGSGAIGESLAVKYLSPTTSTFIIRVSRTHYRLVWAALSLMDNVPVRDGEKCVFRVVRVSGTIRKAEQEAIRRAKDMIMQATRAAEETGKFTLGDILGKQVDKDTDKTDAVMVDVDESDAQDTESGD